MKRICIIVMALFIIMALCGCVSTSELRKTHDAPEGYIKCHVVESLLRSGNGYINENDVEKLETDDSVKIYWDNQLEVFSIINLSKISEVVVGVHKHCDYCGT